MLPGTKSTVADLAWLRRTGLAAAIQAAVTAGAPVVGICGGYQMLGRRILDPAHVESTSDVVDGLGLLDAETTFAGEKRTVRVAGEVLGPDAHGPLGLPGTPVHGYEIHMGRTELGPGAAPLLRLRAAGEPEHADGAVAEAVCGTYVHGLFDEPQLRAAFLNRLRAAHGLPLRPPATPRAGDLDRLADHVETHLDAAALSALIGA